MAYTPHYLLQMIGTVGAANPEIWSCGIRMWAAGYTGFDEVEYAEGLAATACADWVAREESHIGAHVSLDSIKFNRIDASGHYEDPDNTLEYVYPAPIVGGGGSGALPYQVSLVLSWRSNEAERGPASKGRIYSPGPQMAITASNGLFSPDDALEIAVSAALLLNTLDISIDTIYPFRPHIMSQIGGAHHQIDYVVVDNRLDIQRRRANSLNPVPSLAEVLY